MDNHILYEDDFSGEPFAGDIQAGIHELPYKWRGLGASLVNHGIRLGFHRALDVCDDPYVAHRMCDAEPNLALGWE